MRRIFYFLRSFLMRGSTPNMGEGTHMARTKRIPKPSPWAEPFIGKVFDKEKARTLDWFDQGSNCVSYTAPRGKNLWAKLIHPAERCGCHAVFITIAAQLTEDGMIRWAGEWVQNVYNDGHGDVLDVPLFPNDSAAAAAELRQVTSNPVVAVSETPKRPARKRK